MKIGILGTGGVATNSYLPVLKEIEDVELFYVNRTREKAEAACLRSTAMCITPVGVTASILSTVLQVQSKK